MINPKMFENVPGIEFMMKCTFCPAESDGDLTVELEPGKFIPMPICEGCLAIQAKHLNMIESPE